MCDITESRAKELASHWRAVTNGTPSGNLTVAAREGFVGTYRCNLLVQSGQVLATALQHPLIKSGHGVLLEVR